MKILIFVIPIFLFLGCNKTSQIDLRSIPSGAKIYDTNSKKFIAKTPAKVTYVFDNNPNTPKCEVIPPITAVWGDYEAVITEKNIIVCPNQNYKITINQHTFRKPVDYKLIKYKDTWSITPYFGINTIRSSIKVDILDTNKNAMDGSISALYKIGFIDKRNNRVEFNYTALGFQEKDLKLYSVDTIIPIERLKKEIVEPYFKFGLGYSDYSYLNSSYQNFMYTLGLGVYGYITEDVELDLGLARTSHINNSSLAKEGGFDSIPPLDSKIEMNNILVGVNYKF